MTEGQTIGTAYVQIEPSFDGVTPKIDSHFGGEGEKAGNSFGKGFASVAGVVGKAMVGAVAAGGAAVAGVVKQSVDNFAEYEQLIGGVETLFGSSYDSVEEFAKATGMSLDEAGQAFEQYQNRQQTVFDNANKAYATAGMSANEYMNTVNGFAAALNNSLGEYAWQSANYADMAVGDMADNANKMGTSMEAIQNAYAGFSKGNFTMLDNLKLGYGGTKTEMERLMRDAEEMEGLIEGTLSVDSFADVVDAIHIVQENMGITGTTAREASTTIQGSLAAMAASWQNVLTGMGDKNADMSSLIGQLAGNAETFIGNLLPVIEQSLSGVATLIANIAPVIAEKIPGLLSSVLPMLLTSGAQIVQTLAQGLLAAIPTLMPTITDLIINLANMLITMLPQLIEVGAQVIMQLAIGLAQALPTLIPTIVEVVLSIVEYLIDNVDLLIDAAIQLMTGLAVGLINAIPVLIEKAPEIVMKLADAIIRNVPKILQAGVKLMGMLDKAITQSIPVLLATAAKLVADLEQKLLSQVAKFINIGKNIIEGIKKGIANAWDSLSKWFSDKLSGLVDGVKNLFDIHSPSRVFAKEVGQWIPAGIAKGIEDGMGVLDKTMDSMTTSMLIKPEIGSYSYMPTEENNDSSSVYNILAQYLPLIAKGGNVNVILEGDANRLFRVIKKEYARNVQLVGTSLAL